MDLTLDSLAQLGSVPLLAVMAFWLYRVDKAVGELKTAIKTLIEGGVPGNGDG